VTTDEPLGPGTSDASLGAARHEERNEDPEDTEEQADQRPRNGTAAFAVGDERGGQRAEQQEDGHEHEVKCELQREPLSAAATNSLLASTGSRDP
jgi:hypothetical protein